MNESEAAEWQEMLRARRGKELQHRVMEGEDRKQEFEFHMIYDDRRLKWQRLLLDAIDQDAVFRAVCQFFYERFQEKVRRYEAGEPWTDGSGEVLLFLGTAGEIRDATDRALIFGMSNVIQMLIRNFERKHRLKELGWYDLADPQHMGMLLHHILLEWYVTPNPHL